MKTSEENGSEPHARFQIGNAIILATGFSSRFLPITYEMPKGLVSAKGEPLLERQIWKLKENSGLVIKKKKRINRMAVIICVK